MISPSTLVDPASTEVEEGDPKIAPQDVSILGNDPEPKSQPGEQGSATQDDEPAAYAPKEPTKQELKAAEDVLRELRSRAQDYGPQRTIDALIQVVDVVPGFTVPTEWQGEEDEEFRDAPTVSEIAALLIRGCHVQLGISPNEVACLWRNKEKWVDSAGHNVRSKAASLDARTRFMTEGVKATIEINFHLFKTMNPAQKVFTIYHALRQIDADGKKISPDFSGFLDELEYFGPRVFREHVALANSMQRGLKREIPFQLSFLDEQAETEQ